MLGRKGENHQVVNNSCKICMYAIDRAQSLESRVILEEHHIQSKKEFFKTATRLKSPKKGTSNKKENKRRDEKRKDTGGEDGNRK
jgi:hypothetical protein